jgi:Beta-galactosidase trimerisation domain
MPEFDSTPSWLPDQPLIITGNWDVTPIYRYRRGGNPLWDDDEYTRRYQLPTVEAMAAAGVTLAVIDFMKCFGLAAEKEFAGDARGFIRECNARGIRIGAYVGSTIGYEAFLLEVPEAIDWLVRGGDGNFLYYQSPGEDQSFRARMYFMHPGYRCYVKKVLHEAIVNFGAAEIHFDSASVMATFDIFYHPMAIADFQTYLRARPAAELRQRLGISNPDAVLPPRFVSADTVIINDPLFQYWADFRCGQLAAYFAEMHEYIRQVNPEVAISVNTVAGITLHNMEWDGVDHSRLLPHVDILWNEESDVAGISPHGSLTSKIRSYKMVAHAGKRMLTYTGGSSFSTPLALAESAAYNNQTLGMIGDPVFVADLPAAQQSYVQFFRDHFASCFRDVTNVAEVAVLHSFASMAFNSGRPRYSSLLFEQALIQGKILFDIVFDEQLQDLSKYRVLVLPDQECLDDAQMAPVAAFVQNGGGVVITEHTSLYTGCRRRRAAFGLSGLLPNVPVPPYNGLGAEDGILKIAIVQNQIGAGRAAYVPDVQWPSDVSADEHYPLPSNWQGLLETVRWAAGGALGLQIDGPTTLTCEMTVQSDGGRYLIHLLNYDAATAPADGISIHFRIPDGRTVSAVSGISPDDSAPDAISFTEDSGVLTISIPAVITYSIVVVSLSTPAEIAS